MTDRTAERLVGFFLIAVVGALLVLSVAAGLGDEWRNPGSHFTLVLDTGYGIEPGLPVTIRGMDVGRVEAVRLTPDRRVELLLHVNREYAPQVREDSSGLGLFMLPNIKKVEIGDGSPGAPPLADGGALLPGRNVDPLVALQLMAGGDSVDRLSGVLGDVRAILERIDVEDARIPALIETTLKIADDLQAGRGSLGRLLVDDKVVTDVEGALDKIDGVTTRLDALAARLDRTAEALENTSITVSSQSDAIARTAASVDKTAASVERSTVAVEGAIKPMPATIADLDRTLDEMERTLKAIQELPLVRGKLEDP